MTLHRALVFTPIFSLELMLLSWCIVAVILIELCAYNHSLIMSCFSTLTILCQQSMIVVMFQLTASHLGLTFYGHLQEYLS